MVHIALSDNAQRRLVFYLAMEEFLARHVDSLVPSDPLGRREAFFLWQVPPTVIFGRNQVMEAEVNLPYCEEHGIQLYRRKSGGGCVFSDEGNIMLSFICNNADAASAFDRYLDVLVNALKRLVPAVGRSGRNDVLARGKKVSGNAFFGLSGSSVVHGTLLFDSDLDEMERAITPSDAKIASKGISSVRQHVANFKELLASCGTLEAKEMQDMSRFKEYLVGKFCEDSETIVLDDSQISAIENIEQSYLNQSFIYGRKHSWSVGRSGRIEGAGEFSLEVEMDGDSVESCCLTGDFFPLKDGLDEMLTAALRGRKDTAEDAGKVLSGLPIEDYLAGVDGLSMARCLYGAML